MRALVRFIALALVLISAPVHGGNTSSGGASAVDPFILNESDVNATSRPNYDTLGRSTSGVLQGVDTTKKNLILITAGQSNIINTAPSAYVPTNGSKISNLNINDGGIYPGTTDKLISCGTNNQSQTPDCTGDCQGNVALRIADDLITAAKFDRVIIAPIGVGGSPISEWVTGSLGQPSRIKATLARLAAKGITASTTNVWIVILWGQGETDQVLATSESAYTNSFNAMKTASGASASVMWFVAKQTLNASTSAAIQAAQWTDVIDNVSVFKGANADALQLNICGAAVNTACRQAANTNIHWSDAGNYSYAKDPTNGWEQAMHTAFPSLF